MMMDESFRVNLMAMRAISKIALLEIRTLVRVGATGTWAPAEVYQRVPCTRPDRGAIILKTR